MNSTTAVKSFTSEIRRSCDIRPVAFTLSRSVERDLSPELMVTCDGSVLVESSVGALVKNFRSCIVGRGLDVAVLWYE